MWQSEADQGAINPQIALDRYRVWLYVNFCGDRSGLSRNYKKLALLFEVSEASSMGLDCLDL